VLTKGGGGVGWVVGQVMRRLIGEALGRGSMDNISCLLVLLPSVFSAPVSIPMSAMPLRTSMDLASSI
jgi:hypothetical protein